MPRIRWVLLITWFSMMPAAGSTQTPSPQPDVIAETGASSAAGALEEPAAASGAPEPVKGIGEDEAPSPASEAQKAEEPERVPQAEEDDERRRAPGFQLRQIQVVPRYDIRARPVGRFMTDPDGLIRYSRGKHFDLQYAEVDLAFNFSEGYEDRLSLLYQFSPIKMDAGLAREAHFFNAYGVWKFGVGKPVLRFGQFVIPFGNLTEYETHTTILQNLGGAARSLGERLDRGISIEGSRQGTDYWLAFTQGRSVHGVSFPRVITFRLARDLENAPLGPLRLGFSALTGRLPLLPTFGEMPHDVKPIRTVHKTRFALDGEWDIALEKIRFELVFGKDGGRSANGQFLSVNHPLSYQLNLTLQGDRWEQFDGTSLGAGLGVEYKITDLRRIRMAWEYRQVRRNGFHGMDHQLLTLQYLWEFPTTLFSR